MIIQNMHVIYFLIEKKYTIASMTIIRAELQTTDFLFLCRSSLLLSEICQNIHIFSFIRSSYFPKFDAQIAANNVSGSLYFNNERTRTPLGCLTPTALVCMTTHRTLASPLLVIKIYFLSLFYFNICLVYSKTKQHILVIEWQ
jgi:hypothetical protein